MVKEINGLGVTPSYTKRSEQSPKSDRDSSAAAAPEATANNTGDQVDISAQAQSLSALADRVKDLPDVNLARVEQIRTALDNGSYQIDDLVLADKLLNSEALLGE